MKAIHKLLSHVPEWAKQPFRNVAGKPHPFGLAYSERRQLRGLPRYHATTTSLFGKSIQVADAASFLASHQEIFEKHIYRIPTEKSAPVIIDAGANIGLASIYAYLAHPEAKITAIESDPDICRILQNNFNSFGMNQATVLLGAAWDRAEQIRFSPDHADAGRISAEGTMAVSGIRLKDLIVQAGDVDFLKMDIEGAELKVLQDCEPELSRVHRLFVEYHSTTSQPQQLSQLLAILERASMRYYVEHTGVHSTSPLVDRQTEAGFDLQLNIFAIRKNQ